MTIAASTRQASADGRTPEQFADDRRAVERDLTLWTTLHSDTEARRQRLHELRLRRQHRPGALQFDIVPLGSEAELLAVRGELLIRDEDAASPAVRRHLDESGLRLRSVDCLDGRVVRLVGRPADTAEALAGLRRRGVPVSHSHVTAMNPWIKGLSGPAVSDGRRAFPAGPHEPGAGVPVAVVDSGITGAGRTDGWLRTVARDDNVDPLDTVPGHGSLDVGAGHGTFVAGVLQQVAPGADIRMYRAVDGGGMGSEVDIACALLRAARDGATIVNLSVGTTTADDEPPVALAVAMEILSERHPDVVVVAAAGNDGDTRRCWPAAFPDVVGVAGLTAGGLPSAWSNRGDWVTCASVGEGLVSTFVTGCKADPGGGAVTVFGADPWACWTGTSFAAPQIAGALARACSASPGRTPREALAALTRDAPAIAGFGRAVRVLPGT
jgi:hypothetical protein